MDDSDLEERAKAVLRKLLDKPDAEWSCDEQRQAVLLACKGEEDGLILMKTGSGKTMVALIPTVLDKKRITVLILPLKSLITDYKAKLD